MSDFFIGQIMMAGFDFAPRSTALCNGQLLPINQNQALFSLLGTTFGGDGRVKDAAKHEEARHDHAQRDKGAQPPLGHAVPHKDGQRDRRRAVGA